MYTWIIVLTILLIIVPIFKWHILLEPKVYKSIPDDLRNWDMFRPRILECWDSAQIDEYIENTEKQIKAIENIDENTIIEKGLLDNVWIWQESIETIKLIDPYHATSNGCIFYKWNPEGQHIITNHSTNMIINIQNKPLKLRYYRIPNVRRKRTNSKQTPVKLEVFTEELPRNFKSNVITLNKMQGIALPAGNFIEFDTEDNVSFTFTTTTQWIDAPLIFFRTRFF